MTRTIAEHVLAAAIGVLGALAGVLPAVVAVEEQVGLGGLFLMRGVKNPPQAIEIIAISGESASAHGLPTSLREWPRALHAALIETLTEAGTAAIVFDIAFEEPRRDAGDGALAAAIRRSGRVILLERLTARQVEIAGLDAPARRITQVPAVAAIGDAALGRGPFTLPTVPIRTSQFWAFDASEVDGPTLPALAAQAALADVYPQLIDGLAASAALPDDLPRRREDLLAGRRLEDVMRSIRQRFVADPDLADRVRTRLGVDGLAEPERSRLDALVDLYAGPSSRYLNFYGPSGTVPTRAFHEIVRPDGGRAAIDGLAGKVVFVGFAETEQTAQQDEFISVYSEDTGLSLSGVEIGATALANLVTSDAVRPLARPLELGWLLLSGVALTMLAARRRLWVGYAALAIAASGYLGIAQYLFAREGLWLPLVVPLGLQLPAALLGTTLLRYRRLVEQRELLRTALGPYSAPAVIARLARETTARPQPSRVVHGTCLFADVAGYTAIAECLGPSELATLMDGYFAELGRIVAEAGGTVGDIAGDSLVGLWVAADPSPATSRGAAAAALRVGAGIAAFNSAHGGLAISSPIGLDAGPVALTPQQHGPKGAFRPVGDMVNTAARIQSLNRRLGTRILASAAVHDALGDWSGRRVGRFLLFGKHQPIDVWELAGPVGNTGAASPGSGFEAALRLFEQGEIDAARSRFAAVDAADGVSAFYLAQCDRLLASGVPAGWDGTIVMTGK